eukprot:4640358-Alexandrium_andersonii.AAC.1
MAPNPAGKASQGGTSEAVPGSARSKLRAPEACCACSLLSLSGNWRDSLTTANCTRVDRAATQ